MSDANLKLGQIVPDFKLKYYDPVANDFSAIGREPHGLEKQKHLLAEMLDKNQLYVNLSEIDDAQFNVSEEDMALNRRLMGRRDDS